MASTCNPYHSIEGSDPKIYHTYSDCPAGKKVPTRNRRSGTNNWPRCEICLKMD